MVGRSHGLFTFEFACSFEAAFLCLLELCSRLVKPNNPKKELTNPANVPKKVFINTFGSR